MQAAETWVFRLMPGVTGQDDKKWTADENLVDGQRSSVRHSHIDRMDSERCTSIFIAWHPEELRDRRGKDEQKFHRALLRRVSTSRRVEHGVACHDRPV